MAERPRAIGGFYSDKTGVKFDDFVAHRGDAKDPGVPRFTGNVDMAIVSGKLVVTGTTRGGVAIADNSNGGQYRIQAVVDRNGGDADIWFHYTDPNNGYRLRYGTALENMTLERVENGEWYTEGTYYFEPAVGENVTIFIEFNNNYPSGNIHVYVAGTERLNETVAFEQLSGTVAFGGDQAKFDNVKVGYDNNTDHDLDDVGDSLMVNETFDSTDTTIAYDKAGNLIDDGSLQYVYDAWNRLVKVRSAKTGNATIQTAEFDGLGRRIKKVVTNSGDFDGTTVYFYDNNRNILETRDGSNQVTGSFILEFPCIVHGFQKILICKQGKGCLVPFQDANGSVVALVDLGSNIVERLVYSPYGEATVHQETGFGDYDGDADVDSADRNAITGVCNGANPAGACRTLDLDDDRDVDAADQSLFDALPQGLQRHPGRRSSGVAQSFAFQGLLLDSELAQYQNGMRHYDPAKQRFLQRDPLTLGTAAGAGFSDGANLYQYVRANPVLLTDPNGTFVSSVVPLNSSLPGDIAVTVDAVFWGLHASESVRMVGTNELNQAWNETQWPVYPLGSPNDQRHTTFNFTSLFDATIFSATTVCCSDTGSSCGTDFLGLTCADAVLARYPNSISIWVAPPTGTEYQHGAADWQSPMSTLRKACASVTWITNPPTPTVRLLAHEVGHCMGGCHTPGCDENDSDLPDHLMRSSFVRHLYCHNVVDVLNRHSALRPHLDQLRPPPNSPRTDPDDEWHCPAGP